MKSKPSLKNLAKRGLLLNLVILLCYILGCTSSTTPTYLKEDIADAIQKICKDEYKVDVRAKLVGSTLWIYLPLEDIFRRPDKPEKSYERFDIGQNRNEFKEGVLKFEYLIRPVPDKERYQQVEFDKSAAQKINHVLRVLLRVLSSSEQTKKGGPQLFCLITADIKNGFLFKEVFYYLDLKKAIYYFISFTEFQHRTVQDMELAPQIIGDKEGQNLNYKDITFEEFIAGQIQNRIQLKFQKPEVDKNADIDKEVLKIVVNTLKIYGFEDFSAVELYNLFTKNTTILNKAAVLESLSKQ